MKPRHFVQPTTRAEIREAHRAHYVPCDAPLANQPRARTGALAPAWQADTGAL